MIGVCLRQFHQFGWYTVNEMKKVWKCDFCSQTHISPDIIKVHEESCSFSPAQKACYTCASRYSNWEWEECRKELSVFDGEDGNCIGWTIDPDNINTYRKIKLDQLNKI